MKPKKGKNNKRKKVAHQFATELVSTELITTYQPTRFGRVNTECIHMYKPQDFLTLSLTDLIYIYIYRGEAKERERTGCTMHGLSLFFETLQCKIIWINRQLVIKSVHAAQFGSAFAPEYVSFLKSREEYVSDSVQDCKWILKRLRKNQPNLAKINITPSN